MMFFMTLSIYYLIFSLIAGIFLTFITWEKGNTYGFITFAFCVLSFALVWPLVALVTVTDRK